MRTLLAYYSFTGTTKRLCEKLKAECDLEEIKELTKRSKLRAITGCAAAISVKGSAISSIVADVKSYDKIILACPIWAGHLAPAGVAFLHKAELAGKDVSVVAVSKSGQDCTESVKKAFAASKAKMAAVHCIKSTDKPDPAWVS